MFGPIKKFPEIVTFTLGKKLWMLKPYVLDKSKRKKKIYRYKHSEIENEIVFIIWFCSLFSSCKIPLAVLFPYFQVWLIELFSSFQEVVRAERTVALIQSYRWHLLHTFLCRLFYRKDGRGRNWIHWHLLIYPNAKNFPYDF